MRSALTSVEGMSPAAPIRSDEASAFDHAPLVEHALRTLEASAASDWAALASLVVRMPARLLRLLPGARAASGATPDAPLRDALELRLATSLQRLGAPLLQAWFLTEVIHPSEDGKGRTALFRAECARHLAIESRYPYPDEAFLAGLYAEYAPQPGWAAWLAAAPFSPALRDALGLLDLDDERLATAHPLVRLTHVSLRLIRDDWQENDGAALERLSGLSLATLACLRTDTAYLSGQSQMTDQDAKTGLGMVQTDGAARPQYVALRNAALDGLLRSAFDTGDVDSVGRRLQRGLDLFSLHPGTSVIVLHEADGRLLPLPLGIDREGESLIEELALRLDDPVSVVALAARSGQPTAWGLEGGSRSRSVADHHIARLFGRAGFDCMPLPGAHATAIFPHGKMHRQLDATSPLERLCAAASDAIRREQQRQRARTELEAAIGSRYLDRAKKLSHEAKNPLSVIRNYLDMLAQHHPSLTGLDEDVKLINSEIDRLADLLRRGGEALSSEAEPAQCRVGDVLSDLRSLYARPLFEDRGIQLEIRVASGLPAVAMAASRLKQVLINLFRNASEALLPGGRLSVVVPGQLISNGVNCVEIRIIDNGPGLPRERLAQLFSPSPSSKGGDHQGLGLHIVMDILQKSGAYILCRSQPGVGTSFQILVPVPESS